MKTRRALYILMLAAFVFDARAQNDTVSVRSCFNCCRPDAYAPAGIMTDHVHENGEFGIAYSFMNVQMQGNMSGTTSVSDNDIFKNYMMSPAKMNMQMHMLMPMYGITNKLSVMAMVSYNVNSMSMHMMPMEDMMMHMPGMNMSNYNSMPTTSRSSGLGDTKIYALYNMLKNCCHRLVLGAGVSLPTGSIMAKGTTMQSTNDVLPYNMQLGTGTYNLLPGIVYVRQRGIVSFGAALNANIKPGVNARNYCWGNEYSFSPWFTYKPLSWLSFSLRAEAYSMNALYGWDDAIHVSSSNDPTANYKNYGSQQRLTSFVGMNVYAPSGIFKGMRLLIEYGMPVYQNLQGLQMPVRSGVTARLQYNFIK